MFESTLKSQCGYNGHLTQVYPTPSFLTVLLANIYPDIGIGRSTRICLYPPSRTSSVATDLPVYHLRTLKATVSSLDLSLRGIQATSGILTNLTASPAASHERGSRLNGSITLGRKQLQKYLNRRSLSRSSWSWKMGHITQFPPLLVVILIILPHLMVRCAIRPISMLPAVTDLLKYLTLHI